MGNCLSSNGNANIDRAFANFVEYGQRGVSIMRRGGNLGLQRDPVPQQYVQQAQATIPGKVVIYSGCMDSQTSADVGDVSSFGLPAVSAAEKAGGACTNGLLAALKNAPQPTYGQVLVDMRATLVKRGYEQIPQLSASQQIDLSKEAFQLTSGSGRRCAVLIGINYVGHSSGVLNGCVNDVRMMERLILSKGFQKSDIRILTDDPSYGEGMPTKANILKLLQWLTTNTKPGDSLFVHYSGHGTSASKSSEEADGRNEAIVPCDYGSNGLIEDDELFKILVAPIPAGAQLVGVFDCCHSGTIVDLPFIFSGTEEGITALQSGTATLMGQNSQFSFATALQLLQQVLPEKYRGIAQMALRGMAAMQSAN